jgi:hypothetical protein
MKEFKFLAVDPGRTIGYARIHLYGNTITLLDVGQDQANIVLHGKAKKSERWYASESTPMTCLRTESLRPDVFQIEDFVGGGIRSSESSNVLRMVGAFCETATQHGVELRLVTPGERYPYFKKADELVKFTHANRHGRDALAHCLMAIEQTKCGDADEVYFDVRAIHWP